MAKKKLGPGRCVHCLKDVGERNSDHVFPESWYPDSSPLDVEKWQMPSCIPCNTEHGKIEQDFMVKIALCLDPYDPASASIVQKALRSVKPSAAHNARDAQHRLGKGKRILANALQGNRIPDHGLYPGMGDRWPDIPGERTAILIPKDYFDRITVKIVRGIFFIEDGLFIEPPFKIDVYALPEDGDATWTQALGRWGKVYERKPGVKVRRAVAEDGVSSLFEVTFWKQFKTYAAVSR